jgi:hypothetical protein
MTTDQYLAELSTDTTGELKSAPSFQLASCLFGRNGG